jgi:choline transporter-like protein 2/4/5
MHPTDSQGNLCGSGSFVNRPYVYFFDWTQCIQTLNIPSNILKGRPFVCPTTQVCVQQCPNKTSYYTFENYYANRVCTYDVNATNTDNKKLVNDGKCASYIIASTPSFGRCIPEQIDSLANTIIQVC